MPANWARMKGIAVASGISFSPNRGSMRSVFIRQCPTIEVMITRTMDTAVNIEIRMPRPMVTANPRTGPEPNIKRRVVAIRAVTFESTMVA